jgi:hypothetical protein
MTVAPWPGARRRCAASPARPRNIWDAELEGFQPTEEDHALEQPSEPESELGPAIHNAELLGASIMFLDLF